MNEKKKKKEDSKEKKEKQVSTGITVYQFIKTITYRSMFKKAFLKAVEMFDPNIRKSEKSWNKCYKSFIEKPVKISLEDWAKENL